MNAARKKKWSSAAKTAQAIWESFKVAGGMREIKTGGNVNLQTETHFNPITFGHLTRFRED